MIIPTKWPSNDFEPNQWWHDASKFMALLAEHQGFWCYDMDLKYLNIRVDTRNDRFIIQDRDHNRIPPDRVLDAVRKWREMMEREPSDKSDAENEQ